MQQPLNQWQEAWALKEGKMTLVWVRGEDEKEEAWRGIEIHSHKNKNEIKTVQDHCHLTLEMSYPANKPDLLVFHIAGS